MIKTISPTISLQLDFFLQPEEAENELIFHFLEIIPIFYIHPRHIFFYILKLSLRLCMWLKVGVAMVMTSLEKKSKRAKTATLRLKPCGRGCHIGVSVIGLIFFDDCYSCFWLSFVYAQ